MDQVLAKANLDPLVVGPKPRVESRSPWLVGGTANLDPLVDGPKPRVESRSPWQVVQLLMQLLNRRMGLVRTALSNYY